MTVSQYDTSAVSHTRLIITSTSQELDLFECFWLMAVPFPQVADVLYLSSLISEGTVPSHSPAMPQCSKGIMKSFQRYFCIRAARDLCSHSACVCVLRLQSVIIPFCPSLCLPIRFFFLLCLYNTQKMMRSTFPREHMMLTFSLVCVCVCFVCARVWKGKR